jgi:type II secretory pathway pseudopilin PulG
MKNLAKPIVLLMAFSVFSACVGDVDLNNKNIALERSMSDLKQFKIMIDLYREEIGFYPSILGDLIKRPLDPVISKKWKGPYMIDIKDPWGSDYQYVLFTAGSKPAYEIYSFGPHGKGSAENEWIRG